MKTEINILEPTTEAGRKIDMIAHRIDNYRLHLAADHLSMLQIALVENQSNNASATLAPVNVRNILKQFELYQAELEFARTHNDPPQTQYEYGYKVAVMAPKEIERIHNVKAKRVAKEIDMLQKVILGVDSASLQGNISAQDFAVIDEQTQTARDAMALWLGTGVDNSDVGIEAPAFKFIGQLIPDSDLDYAERREPSMTPADSSLPDVPDVAYKAPSGK